MRTLQQAFESVEAYSPAEEKFNRRRRSIGAVVAPLAFVTLLALPLPSLSPEAHRMAAIVALVVVLWVSEALPMPVAAMLGPLLAVLMGVANARQAFASFADPIMFLFIGSFMLAEAMFVHGVDRRLAYTALSSPAVGASGARILIVYGGVAAALSMWISNTATTAMLFPIGMSVVAHVNRAGGRTGGDLRRFAMALMLVTSFAASIGGLATPVGTPPNLIGIGLIERIHGTHIGFFKWMAVGVPLALLLLVFVSVYFYFTAGAGVHAGRASADLAADELDKLGPWTAGQRNVVLAFSLTVCLWLAPGLLTLTGLGTTRLARHLDQMAPESIAALCGAMLLFVLPVNWRARRFTLTWDEAVRIDWGIILLYGGGLALGDLSFRTGLAMALGEGIATVLPAPTTLVLVMLFTGSAILLSEITSNTATANVIVPVAIAVAQAAGVDPLLPALGATLGASMGFMMPISTAPNAIVYSSGYVPITSMMRHGLMLDLAAFAGIVFVVLVVGPLFL